MRAGGALVNSTEFPRIDLATKKNAIRKIRKFRPSKKLLVDSSRQPTQTLISSLIGGLVYSFFTGFDWPDKMYLKSRI